MRMLSARTLFSARPLQLPNRCGSGGSTGTDGRDPSAFQVGRENYYRGNGGSCGGGGGGGGFGRGGAVGVLTLLMRPILRGSTPGAR